MVQVWVKCPRVANTVTYVAPQANKKQRGRPHGTTIAKREINEIKVPQQKSESEPTIVRQEIFTS